MIVKKSENPNELRVIVGDQNERDQVYKILQTLSELKLVGNEGKWEYMMLLKDLIQEYA
jgi:hypothetical protein